MKKYMVYGLISASVQLGEYEANSEEEAIEMAENNPEVDFNPNLCHQCSREINLGDIYETRAEVIE